jgi:hypothetical protein
LEYRSIGVLSFTCITPLLHHSITPMATDGSDKKR